MREPRPGSNLSRTLADTPVLPHPHLWIQEQLAGGRWVTVTQILQPICPQLYPPPIWDYPFEFQSPQELAPACVCVCLCVRTRTCVCERERCGGREWGLDTQGAQFCTL